MKVGNHGPSYLQSTLSFLDAFIAPLPFFRFLFVCLFVFCCCFLAASGDLWDLRSPTRDRTQALSSESAESQPPDHQGNPNSPTPF